MGSKVISITEDVYHLLKSVQLPKESFSDTIKRLCTQFSAKNLAKYVRENFNDGSIPDTIWDELESNISERGKK